MLEVIEADCGISDLDPSMGLAARLNRIRRSMVGRYLWRSQAMLPADIDDLLERCNADPALRRRIWEQAGAGGRSAVIDPGRASHEVTPMATVEVVEDSRLAIPREA